MRIKWLLAAQGVITLLTGVLLLVSPAAIPTSFGLTLTPDANLLCYFYGTAELALSYLSLAALRIEDGTTLRSLCVYFIVYHAAQGLVGLYAITEGASATVGGNSLVHGIIALLFLLYAFRRPGPEAHLSLSQGHKP